MVVARHPGCNGHGSYGQRERRGTSMAALIREAVDRTYGAPDDEKRWKRALDSVGGFRSDRGDVSERHDDALAEAFDR